MAKKPLATCKTDGNSTIDNVRCNIFLRKFETLANRILAEPPRWQVFLVAFFFSRGSPSLYYSSFLPDARDLSFPLSLASLPCSSTARRSSSFPSFLFVSFFSTGHSRLKERAKFNNNCQGKKKQCLSNAQANLFVRLLPCSTISSWLNPEPKDAAYCPLEKSTESSMADERPSPTLDPASKKEREKEGKAVWSQTPLPRIPFGTKESPSDRCAWKSSLPSFLDLIVSIPTPSEGASRRPNELNWN